MGKLESNRKIEYTKKLRNLNHLIASSGELKKLSKPDVNSWKCNIFVAENLCSINAFDVNPYKTPLHSCLLNECRAVHSLRCTLFYNLHASAAPNPSTVVR
jgi:hypothetical protein